MIDRAAISAAVRALDLEALAAQRWFTAKGAAPESTSLAHAFPLARDAALALVDVRVGERVDRYAMPFVLRDAAWREAVEGDGAWRALAAAIAEGRTVAALTRGGAAREMVDVPAGATAGGQVSAALVCRPSPGFVAAWGEEAEAVGLAEERPLGRDQSNTSVVLGDRLLLKGYRRIQTGLNPDLELTAYLSEEAAFPGVPRLAGWAEVVTRESGASTVAMLQAFVPDSDDAYERVVEFLVDLVSTPGPVDLEWATEVAVDLGTFTAGLHAALAGRAPGAPGARGTAGPAPESDPDFSPREATRDEIRAWRMDAHRQLNLAIPAVAAVDREAGEELRREAAAIAARVSRFEAVATTPLVMRIHGDLHLGQILLGEDGYRVIDFEGEPLRTIEERRRPDSPLRDVASLLRSLDHAARSAGRRAAARGDGVASRPGLDIDAWIDRARERFLAAYTAEVRRSGAPITLDLDLLDAFEVAKESYEFVYAATVLPSWLWAPREGMRWLLARGEPL